MSQPRRGRPFADYGRATRSRRPTGPQRRKILATCVYLTTCAVMLRADSRKRWVWDGLSFALFSVLQPFCLKSSLISLGPAALVAGCLYSKKVSRETPSGGLWARRLFVAACGLSMAAAVLQYRPLVHLLLALGIDFYAAVLLLGALLLWVGSGSSHVSRASTTT